MRYLLDECVHKLQPQKLCFCLESKRFVIYERNNSPIVLFTHRMLDPKKEDNGSIITSFYEEWIGMDSS